MQRALQPLCFITGLVFVFIFTFILLVFVFILHVYGLSLLFSVVNYFSYTWCLKSFAFWIRKSPVALNKYVLPSELIFLVWNKNLLLLLVPKDISLSYSHMHCSIMQRFPKSEKYGYICKCTKTLCLVAILTFKLHHANTDTGHICYLWECG